MGLRIATNIASQSVQKNLKEVLPADELAKALSPAATQEKRQNKRANDELFTQVINDKTGLAPSFDEVLREFKAPRSMGNAFMPGTVSELGYGPEAGAMRAEWKALLQHNFNDNFCHIRALLSRWKIRQ